MSLAEIRRLFDYADWASERMFTAIAGLSDEQQNRNIVSSFSSIRATLAHIVGAEWLWLQRWNGISPGAPPEWAATATVAELAQQMRKVSSERRAFLSALDERKLDEEFAYKNLKGDAFKSRLRDVLLHIANHASYHRGQLTTMMRQAGGTPPSTDFIVFTRETR